MAEYFIDPSASINGDGSQSSPYNAVPGANFSGSNLWRIRAGTTLNLGSTQHAVGSNVAIRAYGEGDARPTITGNASTMLMVFSNDNVSFEDLILQRLGAVGGNGVNIGGGAAQNFSAERCRFVGFGNHVYADKAQTPYVHDCDFVGGTVAIQAAARDGVDCTGWRLIGNRFVGNGTDLLLRVSESATFTAGSFVGLEIEGNTFENSAQTAIQLNCAAYVSSGNIAVTGPSTITRSANWPTWPVGSQVFLTNFANRANFGLFTVASVSGTTLTVVETTLVSESSGTGKQIWLWRSDRMFSGLKMQGNTIRGTGATPVLIDTMIGGEIYRNVIESCITAGTGAAGIETGNCDGLLIERNEIADMRTAVFDGMGIFLDNAVRNSRVLRNRIDDCRGATNDNSGAGVAVFNCVDNDVAANLITGCKRGVWVGGSGTAGNKIRHNTIAGCAVGVRVNSSPLAGANDIKCNAIADCVTAVQDDASQVLVNNAIGTTAVLLLDSTYRPLPDSPLIGAGVFAGWLLDNTGKRFRNPPTIGAYEFVNPRRALSNDADPWGVLE